MRRAEAVLQAAIIIRSSIMLSFMSPGAVVWRMNTGLGTGRVSDDSRDREMGRGEWESTIFVPDRLADCDGCFLVGELEDHEFCEIFS